MRRVFRPAGWPIVTVLSLVMLTSMARAGEVRLKNGIVLSGKITEIETLLPPPHKPKKGPTVITPILSVTNPLQRYFVPIRQRESISNDVNLSRNETFLLKQAKMSGSSREIGLVGDYLDKPGPFDPHGRRTVHLRASPRNFDVIQGVTEVTPEFLKIMALNYSWETALSTRSVPQDILDPILRTANGENSADHRLKIARFYIQAEMYAAAERELEAIAREHSDLAETVGQVRVILRQALSQELLGELKLRRAAGQHRFVYEHTRSFPVNDVAAPVLREVREMTTEYEEASDRIDRIRGMLAELQSQLGDDPRIADIGPRRSEIIENLNVTTLPRLDAFTKLAVGQALKPDEKLAVALSGWVLGSDNAVTELDQALRYWQARFLLLDYLRTSDDGENDRRETLERMTALEGVSAARIAQILALLPPPLDASGAKPGQVVRFQVTPPNADNPVAYWALLPPEYHPDHTYPLLVVLHSEKRSPDAEIAFWGGTAEKVGQAQRHGYIVIAPEFTTRPGQTKYDYSPLSHRIVFGALRDARRRFSIDSDRVFLAGHDMGGDATFDIGFSHPDLFAGIIPIAGVSDRYCQFYWENAKTLPMYVVSGELDRDTVVRNAKELMRMMERNYDLIYCEYVGAGPDSFYSEIHKLFDWMSRYRRVKPPKQIETKTLRETDNQVFWYEFDGIPRNVTNVDWTAEKKRAIRPMIATAIITEGNSLVIQSGAARNRVWLSPDNGLVNFDNRLSVRVNGRQRFNDFLKPDIKALLERVRLTGDRQQLYWAVLEF